MAHAHDHHHGSTYYLDQLLIIAFCGAFGVIMILLKQFDVLPLFLDQKFHDPLVWGAVALLLLVAIRAVSLWMEVGRAKAALPNTHGTDDSHDHDHAGAHDHHHHDHDHDHDHSHHHDHDHDSEHAHDHTHEAADDHGHDHGFAPWRYMVLMLPVVLFLLKMPWPEPPETPEGNVIPMKLKEAEESAADPQQRDFWKKQAETKPVQLKGLIKKVGMQANQRQIFQFAKLRMTCCFADAYPQDVEVFVDADKTINSSEHQGKWVKVTGKLSYRPMINGKYITVVEAETFKTIPAPANQFDN